MINTEYITGQTIRINGGIFIMTQKRIAIQFQGLVRGFRFENTRKLYYERIVKPLESQGYLVDFFWHAYDIQFDNIIYSLDKEKFNVIKLVVDSDEKIQNLLENDYKVLTKYKFPPKWETVALDKKNTGIDYNISKHYLKYGWFKSLNSIKKVTELRNDYERKLKNSNYYEWVITNSPQMEPQKCYR